MVNPQLTAYIRSELAQGVAKSDIQKSLASNGWPAQDIADGFAATAPLSIVYSTKPTHAGRKVALSGVFIFSSVVYAAWVYLTSQQTPAAEVATAATQTVEAPPQTATPQEGSGDTRTLATPVAIKTTGPAPTKTSSQTAAAAPAPAKSAGQYVDGIYTGSIADAYYGNVQVRATIAGSKLTGVAFLQYPNDRGTSREINSYAMPQLKSEAIRAQSANVDAISGASDTSQAFVQSLSAALAQAKS